MPNEKVEVKLTSPVVTGYSAVFTQLGPHVLKIVSDDVWVLQEKREMKGGDVQSGGGQMKTVGFEWVKVEIRQ